MKKDTFIKLMSVGMVKDYLKEARKVKYLVEKDALTFTVKDDETRDLVFKGVRVNQGFYGVTFSKKYWVEPVGSDGGYSAGQL